MTRHVDIQTNTNSTISQEQATIYKEHPDLDTPLHRELYEDIIDSEVIITDITAVIGDVVVETNYPGQNYEKRNIRRTGTDLVNGQRVYSLSTIVSDRDVIVTTTKVLELDQEPADLLDLVKGERIPCYLDTQTGTLVISNGKIDIEDKKNYVHHGIEANTHRDTYKGVILVRALSLLQPSQTTVVFDNPGEFSDNKVISANITLRKNPITGIDLGLIDLPSSRLSDDQIRALKQINVITLDEYKEMLRNHVPDNVMDVLKIIFEEDVIDARTIAPNIIAIFTNLFKRQYYRENTSGMCFSPAMFVAVSRDYESNVSPKYDSSRKNNQEDYDTYLELLLAGESIPVSMMVYKNLSNGSIISVISQAHPDADRFFKSVSFRGMIGYQDSVQLCEIDATLEIDFKTMLDQKVENDRKDLVLKVTIRKINSQSGLSETGTNTINPYELVRHFLTNVGNNSVTMKVDIEE